MRLHPPFLLTNGALEPATITAGDPFVKQANLILGVIVLLSAAPNDDTAPPTPGGQALTPTHPGSLSSLISKRRLCHNVSLCQFNLIVAIECLWVAKSTISSG